MQFTFRTNLSTASQRLTISAQIEGVTPGNWLDMKPVSVVSGQDFTLLGKLSVKALPVRLKNTTISAFPKINMSV
jgi:hypothetical protein